MTCMTVPLCTVLAKGEHVALIGDAKGEIHVATAEAVEMARPGLFDRPHPAYHDSVVVARVARVENESVVITDTLPLRRYRYAVLGEVLEPEIAFDEIGGEWWVKQ